MLLQSLDAYLSGDWRGGGFPSSDMKIRDAPFPENHIEITGGTHPANTTPSPAPRSPLDALFFIAFLFGRSLAVLSSSPTSLIVVLTFPSKQAILNSLDERNAAGNLIRPVET